MYFILKLIILLEIFIKLHQCKAYVLHTTQEQDNDNNNELLEPEGLTNSPSLYIDNRVKPADIREPDTLQEIVNYIGADKLSNTAVLPELSKDQRETLTYTELANLLAFWQWAKEQNFYEMQTEQTNTNDNFVTVD
ncbi:hypothetical protein FF38_01822 [Lucilia cuprina]|uniref:Uncharacterized protein n=1 Tax=Lucilia cuprina TaxID=7375 RepID=A0A0L0CJ34_LUCCU|nr:hypothetical protein FF38_01822 [Lucilia cuprina]